MRKHIFIKKKKKKKPSTLIRVIRKNKIQRERERVLTFFVWEKYGLNERNDIKFIQNIIRRRISDTLLPLNYTRYNVIIVYKWIFCRIKKMGQKNVSFLLMIVMN